MQAGRALATHALEGGALPKVTEDPVNPYEDLPILVFSGWRGMPAAP
jgi:hypothetical protein